MVDELSNLKKNRVRRNTGNLHDTNNPVRKDVVFSVRIKFYIFF